MAISLGILTQHFQTNPFEKCPCLKCSIWCHFMVHFMVHAWNPQSGFSMTFPPAKRAPGSRPGARLAWPQSSSPPWTMGRFWSIRINGNSIVMLVYHSYYGELYYYGHIGLWSLLIVNHDLTINILMGDLQDPKMKVLYYIRPYFVVICGDIHFHRPNK